MATNLGKAYVQIMPSAQGIKKSMEDVLSNNMPSGASAGKKIGSTLAGGFKSATNGLGAALSKTLSGAVNSLKTVAKVGGVALGAAAAGTTALVKSSVDAYAAYEQNIGGVETLFKDNADTVVKYAQEAYKTAGVSANAYMENVTSFSASLLQGLGGDTEKAAEVANTAMIDMSDNANKMGTDISMIQNAYQGFAKQNYTMLDNLKLGYGGTASEMARLVNESGVLADGITVDAQSINDVSFDKLIEAIHTVQTDLDITGTTAEEAESTISGSLGMLQASWANLVAGMSDESADLNTLIDNVVSSVGTAFHNLMPVIERALGGVVTLIKTLAPKLVSELPKLISQLLPELISAATEIVTALATALPDILTAIITAISEQLPALVQAVTDILPLLNRGIMDLISAVVQLLPTLVPMLVEGACTLWLGILDSLNQIVAQLIPLIPDMVDKVVTVLIENLPALIEGAITLFTAILDALDQIIETLMPMLPDLIDKVVNALIENMPALIDGAFKLFVGICDGIAQSLPSILNGVIELCGMLVVELVAHVPDLIDAGGKLLAGLASGLCDVFSPISDALSNVMINISDWFSQKWEDAKTWGKDLIDNFVQGIKDKISSIKNTISDVAGTIKEFIGFSEPEKGPLSNFHTYAPDMMNLFAEGIKDNEDTITAQFNSSLEPIMNTTFTPATASRNASQKGSEQGGTITLIVADSGYRTIAKGTASEVDMLQAQTIKFAERGMAY